MPAPTATPTATPIVTPTGTPAVTHTPTWTPTEIPTATLSQTPTATRTPTLTKTPAGTTTVTPSRTPTATRTPTLTKTPTVTPTGTPTPLPVTTAKPGDIVFNEVMAQPVSGGSEWVELLNRTGAEINLQGWTVWDNLGHDPLPSLNLTAGGYAVVAANSDAFRSAFPAFDGLLIEVHPNPKEALVDGLQSLTPSDFSRLMRELRPIAESVGRRL